MSGPLHQWSPSELKAIIELEREQATFLLYRNPKGEQRLLEMSGARPLDVITIGRSDECEVDLTGDSEVSRVHCTIEQVGGTWTLEDDGLSRNGTFVNGSRVNGRVRLSDGHVILCGQTSITFRSGSGARATVTKVDAEGSWLTEVSPAQMRVLKALIQPYALSSGPAAPSTNAEIAAELFVSVETVKSHLRALFSIAGLDDAPSSAKRAQLADAALKLGVRPE